MAAKLAPPLILISLVACLILAVSVIVAPPVPVPPTVSPIAPPTAPASITPAPFTPTALPSLTPTPTATVTETSSPAPSPTLSPTPTSTVGDIPETGADPSGDTQILIGLLSLVLTAISGGALSKLLDSIRPWREWHPSATAKTYAVFALTLLAGGVVTWLMNYAIPTYWQFVPDEVRAFLLALALFGSTQVYHSARRKDGKA